MLVIHLEGSSKDGSPHGDLSRRRFKKQGHTQLYSFAIPQSPAPRLPLGTLWETKFADTKDQDAAPSFHHISAEGQLPIYSFAYI